MNDKKNKVLKVYYKSIDNVKTEYIVKSENEECRELLRARDIYNEKDSIGLPGIILVNYLNKANDVLALLDTFNVKENLTINEQVANLKKSIYKVIKYEPLKKIINNMANGLLTESIYLLKFEQSKDNLKDYIFEANTSKFSSTFYRLLYLEVYNKFDMTKKFIFSDALLFKLFIDSLILETKTLLEHWEDDIDIIPEEYQTDEFEVGNLIDLFYISKYQLQISNRKIRRCKYCNNYFITKNRCNEIYCRRKYKPREYTCQQFCLGSMYRKDRPMQDVKDKMRIERNGITSMLRKYDKIHNTNFKDEFNKRLEIKFSEIEKQEINEMEIFKLKYEWLKEEHEKSKNKNRQKN